MSGMGGIYGPLNPVGLMASRAFGKERPHATARTQSLC